MVTPMNRFDRINNTPEKKPKASKPKAKKPEPPPPPLSFEEKLRTDYYRPKLPFGERGSKERLAYQAEDGRLYEEFRKDMFEHYGVAGHPKVETAYRIAWDHGHSAGYGEVDIYFSELAELLKP